VRQRFPLSKPSFRAQPASASGGGGLWEPLRKPLGVSSASDIRVAAARFWPSTRCQYTSFVMATLECPRTSETGPTVPDGINAADHAAGLSSSLDNLAASVER
jgi:hypothetical protein